MAELYAKHRDAFHQAMHKALTALLLVSAKGDV